MCDNRFYSSLKKKKMHTQTEVSYLGRDLGSTAAIPFHISPIYVELHLCIPVRRWHCHCLVFCKVTYSRMFKEQRYIIKSGPNRASSTGHAGGHEGGQGCS